MAIPTFESLLAPLTEDQVLAAELETAAKLQLPVTAWQPGGVVREVLEINATVLSAQTENSQQAVRGGFLDYARSDWLTLNADQKFDVQRIEGTFAAGDLDLVNNGPTSYILQPGDIRAINAGPIISVGPPIVRGSAQAGAGKTYTSITGGTLPAFSGSGPGKLTVQVVADEAGSASTAPSGYLSALATPLSGVSCNNPNTMSGTDEESDTSLITRCRASWARASPNGPADAYRFFALTATLPDGSPAGCTRVSLIQQDGLVTLYCASASGPLEGDTFPSPGFGPIGAVNQAIQANCVPTGIGITIGRPLELEVVLRLTVFLTANTTLTDEFVQQTVFDSVSVFWSSVPIGGYSIPFNLSPVIGIFANQIEYAAFSSIPGQIFNVNVTSSPFDTAPFGLSMSYNQVATLSFSPESVTVVRLSRA